MHPATVDPPPSVRGHPSGKTKHLSRSGYLDDASPPWDTLATDNLLVYAIHVLVDVLRIKTNVLQQNKTTRAPYRWPVGTDPVNEILSSPGWFDNASPVGNPSPVTTFSAPGGKPAASASPASLRQVEGASSEGFLCAKRRGKNEGGGGGLSVERLTGVAGK